MVQMKEPRWINILILGELTSARKSHPLQSYFWTDFNWWRSLSGCVQRLGHGRTNKRQLRRVSDSSRVQHQQIECVRSGLATVWAAGSMSYGYPNPIRCGSKPSIERNSDRQFRQTVLAAGQSRVSGSSLAWKVKTYLEWFPWPLHIRFSREDHQCPKYGSEYTWSIRTSSFTCANDHISQQFAENNIRRGH